MIEGFKSWFRKPTPWQEEIRELHKALVPMSGEAETLQGELVRSIQNLADECYRNGWMNWDSANEEELEVLSRYLNDPSVFPGTERKLIQTKLKAIRHAGEKGADEGKLAYEEIKFVAKKVVMWCHQKPVLIKKESGNTWLD